MALYGLQWLMLCIPIVITATFVAPAGTTVCYTQKLFGIMGVTMLLQAAWGHRLPLIAGQAAVLLMGVITATAQGYAADVIYPSMMIGGALIALTSLTGLLRHLQRFFTPRVVVSILLLIAFTTARPIVTLIFADAAHPLLALGFMLAAVFLMTVANNAFRGIWKTTVVIVAMMLGALFYYACTAFPATFLHDSVAPQLLGTPWRIDPGLVLAFVFCYIALLINEVGSIQSLGEMIGADGMPQRMHRGVIITGLMNIVAGALGVMGPVDYSLSPGIVASTSCASRYTVLPAAVAMVVLALLPDVVSVLLTIPQPVMGTVLLYLMATQIAAGLGVARDTGAIATFRDGMILGVPIMLNVALTFAPVETMQAIPALIRPIVGNGFVMGIITVLLLEHVFLRTPRKRPTP